MEHNLKIKIVSNSERKEVQSLLLKLGLEDAGDCDNKPWIACDHSAFSGYTDEVMNSFTFVEFKEVSISDLRAMVKAHLEPPQREYLNRTYNLVVLPEGTVADGLIEVPDGADILIKWDDPQLIAFYKKGFTHVFEDNYWEETPRVDLNHVMDTGGSILWQREQPSLGEAPVMMHNTSNPVELTLADRQSQYGEFKDVAITTSRLFALSMNRDMSVVQEEALHMICSKLARIANGDPNHIDSWHDIAGYATLVVKALEK